MYSRRNFIKSGLVGALLPSALLPAGSPRKDREPAKPLIKPEALLPGDTVGLITPASRLFEARRTVLEATEKIRALGFKAKPGKNIFRQKGYLAGSVEERIADLHDMFTDNDVKAIVAIRGGYGSGQLLPYIDYDLVARNPKIIVGYSDITALLLGLHKKTGLVTFHGPVATSTFTDYSRKYFLDILGNTKATGDIADAPYEANLQSSNRIWSLRGGKRTGRLTGGNLTLIQATLGTPWEIDTRDALLFIEEVGEQPYDLDRMLNHLKQAGKFDHCRGVLFDSMKSVEPASYHPAFNSTLSVEEIITDVFKEYNFPVCIGFSLGHIKDKPTLPIGIQAQLDGDIGRLTLLEAAVR